MNKILGMVALSLLISFTMISCGKKDVSEEVLRPVRFQEVYKSGGESERRFSGKASAGSKSNLSFKVAGTILNRHVTVGNKVNKGDLLAELDATDYEIQKQEIIASIAQAEAQVRNSKANYDRVKALYEKDSISKSDLDAARATYDSDKAALEALKQKLDLAHLKTEYTKLIAPMDGVVSEVFARANENVTLGQEIITIESVGDFEVVVGVPESFISRIKKGSPALVTFPSLDSKTFDATTSKVAYSSADQTTYPVTVVINNPSANIRPGMVADVSFKLSSSGNVEKNIVVPANSVLSEGDEQFVFVIKKQGEGVATVHMRAVEVKELTAKGFEIKSGLEDGELVVTAGISKLADGMKVKYNA